MHADSACTGTADSLQRQGATIPPDNRRLDRQIHAGWISFRRYTRELYDRPKVLEVKSEVVVVEALLYGCATWTLLKDHFNKLRTTHQRMLLRILEGLVQVAEQTHTLLHRRPPEKNM